jgi:predicted TIM-barrel fold metal-dependent hydrolase
MSQDLIARRAFLGSVSAGLVVAGGRKLSTAHDESLQRTPTSAGTQKPHVRVPANSADCHIHIYDSRFPADPKAVLHPPDAKVADYRLVQKRLGTTRVVLVQPSTYGVDNRCLLDALGQFGTVARGVAVVNPGVSPGQLKQLHAAGVRGIRFNLIQAGATNIDMVEPLSKLVAPLGWHIQVNITPEQIASQAGLWNRLPVPLVFDHLAHISAPNGPDAAAYKVVSTLLQRNRAWVKLSGAYIDSKVGPPSYSDRDETGRAYVKEAPERLVWASDWPHPTEPHNKPDNAILLDVLARWAPDAATRNRILVENATKLYDFAT